MRPLLITILAALAVTACDSPETQYLLRDDSQYSLGPEIASADGQPVTTAEAAR